MDTGKRPFSHYLLISLFLLIAVATAGTTCVDYTFAERNLAARTHLLEQQVENGIDQSLRIIDDGQKLFDGTLNARMLNGFGLFLEEYERAGRDPARMDLEGVKERIGGDMDLYVIDETGVIAYTTFAPDRGLDFRKVPYFYDYLTAIRQSEGFFPDRIVTEPATGILRKYAYMPTPDHRYVLELGLQGEILNTPLSRMGESESIRQITSLNPYVQQVRIFDSRKQLRENASLKPEPEVDAILDRVIQQRETLRIDDPITGRKVTYLFVDLRDERYGSDVSRIVEITYDTANLRSALDTGILYHLLAATAAFVLAALGAVLLTRRIAVPIQQMASDVDAISRGEPNRAAPREHGRARGYRPLPGERRLAHTIFLVMVLIVGFVVVAVTAADYVKTERDFQETAALARQGTEGYLGQTVRLVDTGYLLYDETLNERMEEGFMQFLAEYERAGRDVSRMDLERVKAELGGEMDLYIINDSAVVERATFAPDLGLDFRQWNHTHEFLRDILQKDGFYPDRVVRETATGMFRKFAYMPTPDHRYILELGMAEDLFKEQHYRLDYEAGITAIAARNPYLETVRLFDTTRHMMGNFSYVPTPEEAAALDRVIQERRTVEIPGSGKTVRYLLIDLASPDYASDTSWILELTYNTNLVDTELQRLLLSHVLVALGAIALSGLLALALSQGLTRPIQRIVQDAEAIARGDLDRRVPPSSASELAVLERSINTMVERLKASMQALQSSEERYRAVVETQSEFIARFRPDGTHIFANDAYCRYFGKTCSEIVGRRFVPQIPEADRALVEAHFRSLTPHNPSANIEHRLILPGGEIRWQQWNDRAFFDADGRVTEYQSVGRDITERKRIEEELRESEKKYRDLVSLLPQGVFEANLQGVITFANQYAFDTFGYTPEDLGRGISLDAVVLPEQRERVHDSMLKVGQGVRLVDMEYTAVRKDGTVFPVMVYATPVYAGSAVAGIRGVIVDITRLKKVEEDIRRLNEELERRVAERTAELESAIGELESFSYSVSHDLRSPLRAIDGYSGILLSEYRSSLPPEARVYLEKVRSNTQQMANLIDALLNLSRISRSSLTKEAVDITAVVKTVWENLRSECAGRQVEFTIGPLPPSRADAFLISQVYHNLLSNALKFTRPRAMARIEVGSFAKDGETVYFVRDNGVGFDPRYAEKLFGVFQRLHSEKEFEGTGVGLAIVKRILDRHGGRIWVESGIDRGTTFFFTCGSDDDGSSS
ncbi:MAG: PAS domain S-box protein [Methanomicrobiales archaeon]|nr:PAS domain S-box protein [Methanomicrobiales archaeon]